MKTKNLNEEILAISSDENTVIFSRAAYLYTTFKFYFIIKSAYYVIFIQGEYRIIKRHAASYRESKLELRKLRSMRPGKGILNAFDFLEFKFDQLCVKFQLKPKFVHSFQFFVCRTHLQNWEYLEVAMRTFFKCSSIFSCWY